jgi:hypothetical protein
VQVCQPGSLVVAGLVASLPHAVGAVARGARIELTRDAGPALTVTVRLSGIRAGFAGVRFPTFNRRQAQRNEQFWAQAHAAAEL